MVSLEVFFFIELDADVHFFFFNSMSRGSDIIIGTVETDFLASFFPMLQDVFKPSALPTLKTFLFRLYVEERCTPLQFNMDEVGKKLSVL